MPFFDDPKHAIGDRAYPESGMADSPGPHERAKETHEAAATRHEEAAAFWGQRGDLARADLERRNAAVEREAADIEDERARLARRG